MSIPGHLIQDTLSHSSNSPGNGPPSIAGLILPLVIGPAIDKMTVIDAPPSSNTLVSSCLTLGTAFAELEAVRPGFAYDFIRTLLRNTMEDVSGGTGNNTVSTESYTATVLDNELQESVLRLAGTSSNRNSSSHHGPLEERAMELKTVLARIPDQIGDRKTFLETIKEIAGAIKRLLDAVNAVHGSGTGISSSGSANAMESRKREFVRYSKRFSNCLKEYFRHGDAYAVFRSANCLVYQADVMAMAGTGDRYNNGPGSAHKQNEHLSDQ